MEGPSARPSARNAFNVLLTGRIDLIGESLQTSINIKTGTARDLSAEYRSLDRLAKDWTGALGSVDLVLIVAGHEDPTDGETRDLLTALLTAPSPPLVAVLAERTTPQMTAMLLAMGCRGVLSHGMSLASLIEALRRIRDGGTVVFDQP